MSYTKGKWSKEGNKIKAFGRGTVAICPSPTDNEGVLEFVDNARLIAAAPDMYEAYRAQKVVIQEARKEGNMETIKVTEQNIGWLTGTIAGDQADELQPGDETWGIIYQPGNQRGQMSRYLKSGRGAIEKGGDSDWGDWRSAPDGTEYLRLDETDADGNQIGYGIDGEQLDTDDDGIIIISCYRD